nr:STARP-like antigen [Hymenolepis microstoma]
MLNANLWQENLSSMSKPFQKNISNKITNLAQNIEKKRNKKKVMERCRRKKISENLMKVHELTLEIIGADDEKEVPNVRLEKAKILELCFNVLNRLSDLLEQSPNLQKRLRMSFKGQKANALRPPVDSGFHEIPADFNEGFTSSSDCKSKSSSQSRKRQKIWRPYI